jgi:hypothetical protein
MTEEIRSYKRRHLLYYLEVYDDDTKELLGHLVDLTTTGLKLMSRKQIPSNRDYWLRMVLPEEVFPEKDLYFEAQSRWSSNEVNPDFYDTGFSAPKLDLKTQNIIRDLLSEISFHD